jgi:site-specific DNA recombinase
MPRVAIVTRVSTEEQTRPEYNSCQSQQDICRHYVEIQREKGWEVLRVYEDGGHSGRNLKRPGIQALLRDVRRGLVDIILCTRLDRLARSIKLFYDLWTVFEKHNVTFVSATESFDTSTAAGSPVVNLLLSFGQWEVTVVSERTSLKMLARARRGLRYNMSLMTWVAKLPLRRRSPAS